MLAIKIIKQALACFAVLGIIVLMQQNVGMADELSFVKKHVVENHIELDNIINGVKNIIAECSRFSEGHPDQHNFGMSGAIIIHEGFHMLCPYFRSGALFFQSQLLSVSEPG